MKPKFDTNEELLLWQEKKEGEKISDDYWGKDGN